MAGSARWQTRRVGAAGQRPPAKSAVGGRAVVEPAALLACQPSTPGHTPCPAPGRAPSARTRRWPQGCPQQPCVEPQAHTQRPAPWGPEPPAMAPARGSGAASSWQGWLATCGTQPSQAAACRTAKQPHAARHGQSRSVVRSCGKKACVLTGSAGARRGSLEACSSSLSKASVCSLPGYHARARMVPAAVAEVARSWRLGGWWGKQGVAPRRGGSAALVGAVATSWTPPIFSACSGAIG